MINNDVQRDGSHGSRTNNLTLGDPEHYLYAAAAADGRPFLRIAEAR